MIGGGHDEAALQRVPFALLDVDGRGHRVREVDAWSCLPGLIEETAAPATSEPVPVAVYWSSLSSSSTTESFPREIGLRVLSSSHYHVHAIRIAFQTAKRPSRLEVSASSSTSKRPHVAHSLDALSEYFCADFKSASAPLVWSPESALDWLLAPTEVTISLTTSENSLHQTTEFIKCVVYKPHVHPENPAHEVAITSIELLGTFQLPGRTIPLLDDDCVMNDQHADLEDVGDDIRRILETVGLPQELINELMLAESEQPESPVSPTEPTESQRARQVDESEPTTALSLEYPLDSVFDLALRDFIHHKQREDEMFALLETPRNDLRTLHGDATTGTTVSGIVRSLSLSAVRTNDRNHLEAIATHTFGSFFTQSLTNDDNELQLTAIQSAERFAPLLPLAGMKLELVYEGLVAVVVLATSPHRRHVSLAVFHAVLHLVQTTFQERRTSFRLVTELPKGKINTGLQRIVHALVQLPHCWALGDKTTINRELLKAARLLLSQETTRTSFVLAVCVPPSERVPSMNSCAVVNRLRLMRWLLQRHREELSSDSNSSIRQFCADVGDGTYGVVSSKASELIQQCLALVGPAKPAKLDLNAQLQAVKRHLQEHEENQSSDEVRDAHVPLFDAFPLTQEEREVFVERLRQFFKLHPQPTALYQHEFTMASLEDHATHGEFRKGNIVFKGKVESRTVPVVSFHEDIERKAKPFKFNAPQAATSDLVTMETAFAKFRGTVEVRTKQPEATPAAKPLQATKAQPLPQQTKPLPREQATPSVLPRRTPPTTVRRPSDPKLNRVVPVDSAAIPDTATTETTVTSDAPAVLPSTTPQRASTAAPAIATGKPPASSAPGADSASADPTPSPSSTKPPLPKTAPAGKARGTASQADASGSGCVVQ